MNRGFAVSRQASKAARRSASWVLWKLYANFPWIARLPQGPTRLGRTCKIYIIASDTRTGADGADRRMVVGGAEVNGDCQEREAILGIGVFRLTDGTWSKEILDPAVTPTKLGF